MARRVLALALALHTSPCDGVTFKLEPSHERCISETIPVRSLLAGDWTSSGADDQSNTQVRAPSGKVLFENKHATGHFSVTADTAGEHHVCVRNEGTAVHEVNLNVKQARHPRLAPRHTAAQWPSHRPPTALPPPSPSHRPPHRTALPTALQHGTALCAACAALCFALSPPTAHLWPAQAVEVDDHNLVAKQEHIEAIEAELDRMKKIATHVYEEMVSRMRCTSEPARSPCPRRCLTHLLTCAPQVYMRDRSDAMHITSESTRGRRRSIRSAGPPRTAAALPQLADLEPEPGPSRSLGSAIPTPSGAGGR